MTLRRLHATRAVRPIFRAPQVGAFTSTLEGGAAPAVKNPSHGVPDRVRYPTPHPRQKRNHAVRA